MKGLKGANSNRSFYAALGTDDAAAASSAEDTPAAPRPPSGTHPGMVHQQRPFHTGHGIELANRNRHAAPAANAYQPVPVQAYAVPNERPHTSGRSGQSSSRPTSNTSSTSRSNKRK